LRELSACLPGWPDDPALQPHLRAGLAGRHIHLAAAAERWDDFDTSLVKIGNGLAGGDPGLVDLIRLHLLPGIHLSGISGSLRAMALKRMPLPVYREWRDIQQILDRIHEE
jgi:hypothetical protein